MQHRKPRLQKVAGPVCRVNVCPNTKVEGVDDRAGSLLLSHSSLIINLRACVPLAILWPSRIPVSPILW